MIYIKLLFSAYWITEDRMNSLEEKEENLDNNKIFKELMKNALRSGITSSKLYQYIESRSNLEEEKNVSEELIH